MTGGRLLDRGRCPFAMREPRVQRPHLMHTCFVGWRPTITFEQDCQPSSGEVVIKVSARNRGRGIRTY